MKNLFELKSVIALVMVAALIAGLFYGKIDSKDFVPLVSLILTFYFVKNKKREEK